MTRYHSNEGRIHPEPAQERRRHPRAEDSETTAVIARYMRLADTALEQGGTQDDHSPGDRIRRYFELADIWMNASRRASSTDLRQKESALQGERAPTLR